jgi:hypothetical protein
MNHHLFLMCLCGNRVFIYIYISIKLKLIIMKTLSLNIVDSSFEHVLHSHGFHLVSTYKYEIGKFYFFCIYYLLDDHLSSLELRENNMANLNQCLLLNT